MKGLAPLDDWPIWARHGADCGFSFPDGLEIARLRNGDLLMGLRWLPGPQVSGPAPESVNPLGRQAKLNRHRDVMIVAGNPAAVAFEETPDARTPKRCISAIMHRLCHPCAVPRHRDDDDIGR